MNEAQVYDYNLENLSVGFLGNMIRGGFGSGSAIKIEPEAPYYQSKSGVDGTHTRYATGNRCTKVTIQFGQASVANTYFATILLAALNTPNGGGMGVFWVKDTAGLFLLSSPAAYVAGPPSGIEFGGEPSDWDWELWCPKSNLFAAGGFQIA